MLIIGAAGSMSMEECDRCAVAIRGALGVYVPVVFVPVGSAGVTVLRPER